MQKKDQPDSDQQIKEGTHINTTYPEYSGIEEVSISEEPVIAEREQRQLPFPAITYRDKDILYFNTKTNPHLKSDYIRFAITSEYIIMLPVSADATDAYKISKMSHGSGKFVRVPVDVRNKKIKVGVYRLYKFRDGLCFKRYEPLGKEAKLNG